MPQAALAFTASVLLPASVPWPHGLGDQPGEIGFCSPAFSLIVGWQTPPGITVVVPGSPGHCSLQAMLTVSLTGGNKTLFEIYHLGQRCII